MIQKIKCILYLCVGIPIAIIHLLMAMTIVFVARHIRLARSAQKSIYRRMKYYIFHLGYAMLRFWFSKSFTVIYCNVPKNLRSSHFITISNHVSDFDWMFVSYTIEQLGYFDNLMITMKASLRKAPFIGYLLEAFDSVFLARNGKPSDPNQVNNDLESLQQSCEKTIQEGGFLNPLLFPEGTYLCAEEFEKAKKYHESIQNDSDNLMKDFKPEFTLIPRVGGFQQLLLCQPESVKSICNFTLFTTPYNRFVFDNYPNKKVAFGSKSYHLNILVQFEIIPDELLELTEKVREMKKDSQEGSQEYPELMKQFKEQSTKFLIDLFQKKQKMIEKYSKLEIVDGNGENFYNFCIKELGVDMSELKMKVFSIDSNHRFTYMASAILLMISVLGAIVLCLVYCFVSNQPLYVAETPLILPGMEL